MSKYDCNKAIDYDHEQFRVCEYYEGCDGCPLYRLDNSCQRPVTQERIDAVQAWSDLHPESHKKTYTEDFFEKFPNAKRGASGVPTACLESCYPESKPDDCAFIACTACWKRPIVPQEKIDAEKKYTD